MGAGSPIRALPSIDPDDVPADAGVLRMLLGARLRRLRESASITPERAGAEIRGSRSKISRMETGRVRFKLRDVTDLLTLYGVTDEELRAEFLELARRSAEPDWWAEYSEILPDWFEPYLRLESAASTIRSFEVQFVPSLFQTKAYSRAAIWLSNQNASPAEIEHRQALRLKRQDLLTRADPPRIWSIMDESVLRRPVGGPLVLRAQLKRLIEVAAMPHVTTQVVPFARAGQAGESGSFTVLRFGEPDLPDVVYIEQLTSAIYLEQRPDVEHYLQVADQLSNTALTPAETRAFIEQVARETQAVPPSHLQAHNQSLWNEQGKAASMGGGVFLSAARNSGSGPPGAEDGNAGSPNGRYLPGGGISRLSRRSLSQAFTDGIGGIFDTFGGIGRRLSRLPAFDDTLAQDARELCRELGLEIQNTNGSDEETGQ
jgi:transcriptional regulator with XRE-family HTH domain